MPRSKTAAIGSISQWFYVGEDIREARLVSPYTELSVRQSLSNEPILGVSRQARIAGEAAEIYTEGEGVEVEAGGEIQAGQRLASDNEGLAIPEIQPLYGSVQITALEAGKAGDLIRVSIRRPFAPRLLSQNQSVRDAQVMQIIGVTRHYNQASGQWIGSRPRTPAAARVPRQRKKKKPIPVQAPLKRHIVMLPQEEKKPE